MTQLTVTEKDAALIIRENGEIEMHIPELNDEEDSPANATALACLFWLLAQSDRFDALLNEFFADGTEDTVG